MFKRERELRKHEMCVNQLETKIFAAAVCFKKMRVINLVKMHLPDLINKLIPRIIDFTFGIATDANR